MDASNLDNAFRYAKSESQAGRFAEAAKVYRRMAECSALDEQRAIFHLLAAIEYENAAAFDDAIRECHAAIAIDPTSAKTWRTLGRALREANRPGEAESALRKSISLAETPTAFIYLGCLCNNDGRFEEAESCFRKAIELADDFDEGYYCLGCALQNRAASMTP